MKVTEKIAGSGSGSISQRYGSVPNCHGSATLLTGFRNDQVPVNSLSTHLPRLAENSAKNWPLLQVLDILLQLLSEEGLVLLNDAV